MRIGSLLKGVKLTSQGSAYFAQLEALEKNEVVVGFMGNKTYPEGQTVVEVATVNELGSSDIPARPFMRQMADHNADKIQLACGDMGKAIADGQSAQTAMEDLGDLLKGMVQDEITFGEFAPNAPATIARKGSSHPLIDTGLMRGSVESKVRRSTR